MNVNCHGHVVKSVLTWKSIIIVCVLKAILVMLVKLAKLIQVCISLWTVTTTESVMGLPKCKILYKRD